MEKREYTPSAAVQGAAKALAEHSQKKPEEYRSGWETRLAELMARILNQEEFRYNLNGDALYRQLRDQAAEQGRLAMADAAGQAAALTGGYGNSYAQSVGQQAYQRQLENLSDRIPELYTLALEQYRQQTEGLRQRYALLTQAEEQDYGRYRDALDAWQQEADSLRQQYADAREADYGAWRDRIADEKWQMEYDENLRRYERDWAQKHPAVTPAPSYTPVYMAPKKQETKKEETGGSRVVLL